MRHRRVTRSLRVAGARPDVDWAGVPSWVPIGALGFVGGPAAGLRSPELGPQ